MGDVGDYWNEHKEFMRAARSMWVECLSPSCQFGGNPVKVAPGYTCRHCGVRAPGKRGSDAEFARRSVVQQQTQRDLAEDAGERAKRKLTLRTCRACQKIFRNEQGRAQHERDKHADANLKPFVEATTYPDVVF